MIGELMAAAVSAFDSISQQSMTIKKQYDTVYDKYHGDKGNGTMGDAEKFKMAFGVYSTMKMPQSIGRHHYIYSRGIAPAGGPCLNKWGKYQ